MMIISWSHDVHHTKKEKKMEKAKNVSTGPREPLIRAFHPVLKRQDRLGKEPFAGFGTVVEDIKRSGYTKNQPILLGAF